MKVAGDPGLIYPINFFLCGTQIQFTRVRQLKKIDLKHSQYKCLSPCLHQSIHRIEKVSFFFSFSEQQKNSNRHKSTNPTKYNVSIGFVIDMANRRGEIFVWK